jgi:hypothetical protein
MNHDQIAKLMRTTVAEVVALEESALRKCRAWCDERGLDFYQLLPYPEPVPANPPNVEETEA